MEDTLRVAGSLGGEVNGEWVEVNMNKAKIYILGLGDVVELIKLFERIKDKVEL